MNKWGSKQMTAVLTAVLHAEKRAAVHRICENKLEHNQATNARCTHISAPGMNAKVSQALQTDLQTARNVTNRDAPVHQPVSLMHVQLQAAPLNA